MSDLKPVKCGCGGEANVETDHDTIQPVAPIDWKRVVCTECNIRTTWRKTEAEAIEAWNRAMGRNTGKWIAVDDGVVSGRCSVCGYEANLYENDVYGEHYCPNCGARLSI